MSDATSKAREAVVHDLKVWPEFFAALWDNTKSFEWRKDDRDYRVGDTLILREWSEATGYTGRGTKRTIAYILRQRFGVPDGFAVLGFAPLVDVAAHDALTAEVREWMCEACNTVYPGPPQQGFSCVVCPKCGGSTAPRTTIARRKAEAERDALKAFAERAK